MAKKATPDETPMGLSTAEAAPVSSGEAVQSAAKKERGKKKTVMFDKAMQALGTDAKPLEIQAWIKDKYRVTLKPTLLSTYKGNWLRKHVRGGNPSRVAVSSDRGSADATLADIRTLQSLIARVGVPQLKEMLTLLGVN